MGSLENKIKEVAEVAETQTQQCEGAAIETQKRDGEGGAWRRQNRPTE